jgi:hypothetical protein
MPTRPIVPPAGSEAERSAPAGRVCMAAGCGKPLTGRQTRACSDRHRAAANRQTQEATRLAEHREIVAHLEAAIRRLGFEVKVEPQRSGLDCNR